MVQFECNFSDPQTYDGSLPTTKTESWQFKKEVCTYNSSMYAPTTTISTSTDIALYASFTAGEVLMAVLMMMLIFIEMIKMLVSSLKEIKTKRKFLGYSNADVEIREDM